MKEAFASFDSERDPGVDQPPLSVQIGKKAVAVLRIEGTAVHRTIPCHSTIKVADTEALMRS